MTYKNCPTVLACSVEFQQIKPRNEIMVAQINKIKQDDATKELIPTKIANNKLAEFLSMPSLCIILAYLLRMDELDSSLQEDLE